MPTLGEAEAGTDWLPLTFSPQVITAPSFVMAPLDQPFAPIAMVLPAAPSALGTFCWPTLFRLPHEQTEWSARKATV
jgi:hypothetical protein